MRRKGFEPSHPKAHAPEACVSAVPPPPRIFYYTLFLDKWKAVRKKAEKIWYNESKYA